MVSSDNMLSKYYFWGGEHHEPQSSFRRQIKSILFSRLCEFSFWNRQCLIQSSHSSSINVQKFLPYPQQLTKSLCSSSGVNEVHNQSFRHRLRTCPLSMAPLQFGKFRSDSQFWTTFSIPPKLLEPLKIPQHFNTTY